MAKAIGRTSPLDRYVIRGISSMVRDLSILTHAPEKLEAEIMACPDVIRSSFFSGIKLVSRTTTNARVGDVVLFELKNLGAYPDMETLWGGRVPLKIRGRYIGVLCERASSKLITASFPNPPAPAFNLELQLIAQAGGVGFATGFSRNLEQSNGNGRPSDVHICGALLNKHGRTLNLFDTFEHSPDYNSRLRLTSVPPVVLVLGTATDVGKTTIACALLAELSKRHRCGAIKASGTGWYEDSLLHTKSGSFPALNFTFVGLPTTYYIKDGTYIGAARSLLRYIAHPECMPDYLIPPGMRDRARITPDLVVIEHGGDLIDASIPIYLRNKSLMAPVRVVLLCSESALSLKGALSELRHMNIRNCPTSKLFASVPLINPEGFYRRVRPLLDFGLLDGIFDVNKPLLVDEKEKRCHYSVHYAQILSIADLARRIEAHLDLRLCHRPSHDASVHCSHAISERGCFANSFSSAPIRQHHEENPRSVKSYSH
jgi:hypothetical protein